MGGIVIFGRYGNVSAGDNVLLIKEDAYEYRNNFINCLDSVSGWGVANVVLQQEMELLSQWRNWTSGRDFDHPCSDGPDLEVACRLWGCWSAEFFSLVMILVNWRNNI